MTGNRGYEDVLAGKVLWIVRRAYRLLEDKPLCDNCLGRMFALLGRGYTNRERGEVLKKLIVQSIHMGIREGEEWASEALERLSSRLLPHSATLYTELRGREPSGFKCYICGYEPGGLDKFYEELARKILREIVSKGLDVENYLLGVSVSGEVVAKEEELKTRHGLAYAESIGSEIKREVSKRIQYLSGGSLVPEFVAPDVVIEITFPEGRTSYRLQPVLLAGRYRKLARRISQSVWVTRSLVKKYPYSVEEAFFTLAEKYSASTAVLHAAGREDADVRMLGTGRPFVVELKNPRLRAKARRELGRTRLVVPGLVDARIVGMVSRKDVALVKEEGRSHSKVYRATIISSKDLGPEDIDKLRRTFTKKTVKQRTPRRVRHRRPDVVRERLVYSVDAVLLAPRVIAALIHAEGGLYIKELVSGDGGDTTPSFSEVIGAELYCAELDVVSVDSKLPWARVEYIYNPGRNPSG